MWLYSRAGHMDLHYGLSHVAGLQGKKETVVIALILFRPKKLNKVKTLRGSLTVLPDDLNTLLQLLDYSRYGTNLPLSQTNHFSVLQFEI